MSDVLLVGKPNSGKSSLFNQLTGLNQKIGNFSGVTVECLVGKFGHILVSDLPGLKSLRNTSPEEAISKLHLLNAAEKKQVCLFIANGMQMEDNLMLFSEIADLQIPTILCINFKDDLDANKVQIDIEELQKRLACPIYLINSKSGEGIDEVKSAIIDNAFTVPNGFCRSLYEVYEDGEMTNNYTRHLQLIEESTDTEYPEEYEKRQRIIASLTNDIMDTGLDFHLLRRSKLADKILLHPIWGALVFLVIMYLVFQSVFTISAYPMDWIDLFTGWSSEQLQNILVDSWLATFVTDALIPGIGGVIIFIPQIAILFFLLGLLEQSGYLSRISFITDGFLSKFGLSGKSVIPLMSSWACAIPAIMSARIIDNPRERMAILMAAPLMTCSARLPVYTILIALLADSPDHHLQGFQGLILLAMYLIGTLATLLIAWLYTRRSSVPENLFWSLELPVYRFPHWKNIWITVYQKTKSFVVEAGKIILVISLILWFLASFSPKPESFHQTKFEELSKTNPEVSRQSVDLEYSYLGYLGKSFEPIIKPLGYDWKIGIALISSFAARDVFVGTMSTIYSIGSEDEGPIISRLKAEKNPNSGKSRFNFATIISLLLFYAFAMQCMSTMAIVVRESGSWWFAIAQFFILTAIAYLAAFIAYQLLS